MRKAIAALILLIIAAGGFYYYLKLEYKQKPGIVRELDEEIRVENEKLIAAQIIASELKQVTRLIEGNLAQSQRDSLAEDASLPFMNQLTDIMRNHGIDLKTIEPGRRRNYNTYIATPYMVEVYTSYKSLVNFLYIGRPTQKYQDLYGTKPRLQLGDKFASIAEIPLFLEQHKIKVPENRRAQITSSLRVDGSVTMGIVQDVKTQLRKSNQLKVNYSAKKRPDNAIR